MTRKNVHTETQERPGNNLTSSTLPSLGCAVLLVIPSLHSEDGKFLAKRLSVLLSYATGVVAADSAVFVDFDTLPSSGASLNQTLSFLLADEARPLRAALVGEVRTRVGVCLLWFLRAVLVVNQ